MPTFYTENISFCADFAAFMSQKATTFIYFTIL